MLVGIVHLAKTFDKDKVKLVLQVLDQETWLILKTALIFPLLWKTISKPS